MSSEWPTVRLGEHVEACLGKMLDAQKNKGIPQPYLGNSNVRWGQFDLTDLAEMRFEPHEEERYSLLPGDLVVCEGGEPGRSAIWTGPAGMKVQKALHRIRPKGTLNNYYLFYWFQHAAKTGLLEPYFTGTTIKHLTGKALAALEVPLPAIEVQRAMVDVLKQLDDRITLLRETNATLEAIAQALFKSWFVDFDPVRAKMAGRAPEGMDEATAALFPDAFEFTEDPIPLGWMRSSLGDFCSVTIGGLWGKDDQEESDLVPAISLRGVDLEHLRSTGFAPEAPIRWVKASAMEKRRLSTSQVLIASSGAGPCGRPLWAGGPFETMYGLPVIFSNFVKRLECGSEIRALYVDRLLADMRESKEIWNFINGTSIPNLDDKLLLASKQVVMPPDLILEAFAGVLRSIYDKLYGGQSQTLATLRDTLLPRLISGQLRLPEVSNHQEALNA
ncbi:restriction endonuclease subunit S [Aquabacterium sp.]|uniref:restriction endonuclease subunit S n=1 Tax=Aquabacterium sp. TaxID=1872578 RepID=UPI0035AEAAF0